MKPTRLLYVVCCFVLLSVFVLAVNGCKDDETVTNPPPPATALSVSNAAPTVAAGSNVQVFVRGGRKPYAIEVQPDTSLATAVLGSDSVLTISGLSSGSTSVRVKDADTNRVTIAITITGPITIDLFPLTPGHKFTYVGYATAAGSGSQIPDPTNLYRTIWTILTNSAPSPLGGTATALQDSTTGSFLPAGVYAVRTLLIRKTTAGDFEFMQTIGPFKRAFGIPTGTASADTLKWIAVAKPTTGLNNQWTAFDSTFLGTGGTQVRLQIFGKIETVETITDSSTARQTHVVYRSRTWRKITVGGTVVQDDATTSRLWLERNVGPVQIRIVEDTENIGHFRVLRSKNF
ncbi:MAG: hypothetical protein AAB393_02045 [Bacteroidota bacterium]